MYFVRSYGIIEKEKGGRRVADRGQGIKTLGPRAQKQKTAHFVCQMTEGWVEIWSELLGLTLLAGKAASIQFCLLACLSVAWTKQSKRHRKQRSHSDSKVQHSKKMHDNYSDREAGAAAVQWTTDECTYSKGDSWTYKRMSFYVPAVITTQQRFDFYVFHLKHAPTDNDP